MQVETSQPKPAAVRWWRALSILAILGAAITTSLIVDFVKNSPSPGLYISTVTTCLLIALAVMIGLRGDWRGLAALAILAAGGGVVTLGFVVDFIQNLPAKSLTVPSQLVFTTFATVFLAAAAVIASAFTKGEGPSSKITWTNNGITLLGVLASALAFNLPPEFGPWIGWPIIAATLWTVWPVFDTADQITRLQIQVSELKDQLKKANRSVPSSANEGETQ
ncbi:hypothetical protein ACIQTW_20710 [Paenarthrobacter sp. NPDC090517]|uniref:hypothetical protein n=1 Tax=Paenarthrobacter sp. NPDC090517 TaxID=3364381 RepID=UPI003820291A